MNMTSMKERMGAKTAQFKIDDNPSESPATTSAPRTAMGRAFSLREEALDREGIIENLQSQLQRHEGSVPVREVDPRAVRASAFANRDEATFSNEDFADLKLQIGTIGKNTQPILVRPIAAEAGLGEGAPAVEYEIVYGLRRHRACLELGINVRAEIRALTDIELFVAMSAENLSRVDLSTYELGHHFHRALDKKIFQTQQQLAAAHGLNRRTISRALACYNFPKEIIEAFPTKLEIRAAWIDELQQALEQRRDQVIRTANALKSVEGRTAEKVFAKLTRQESTKPAASEVAIKVKGKGVGTVKRTSSGVVIRLGKDSLAAGHDDELARMVASFIESH